MNHFGKAANNHFTRHASGEKALAIINRLIRINQYIKNTPLMNLRKFYSHPLALAARHIVVFFVLAAIVSACVSKASELIKDSAAKAAPGTPVDAIVVQPGIVSDELEITGTLVANQQVAIVSELTRRIVHVNVKEGTRVKKGALLF